MYTGGCLKELKGGTYMLGFDAHDGFIAGGNRSENVTVCKIDRALGQSQTELASLPY